MSIPIVPEFVPRVQYTASGSQTTFNIPFPFFFDSDLTVYQTHSGSTANDISDILALNVNYNVTGANTPSGGTIELIVGASANDIITIQRTSPVERTSSYADGQAITADELNQDLNDQVMMLQDQVAYILRTMPRYPVSAVVDDAATELPLLAENEYWKGGPNDSIVPTTIQENANCSTLRSDLAQNGSAVSSGANLVGYFSGISGSTNVQSELDNINSTIAVQNSILDFGGDNTGVADNTAAFNAALVYYAANTDNAILFFPQGTYLFNSQPNPVTINLKIAGQGSEKTLLLRNYTEASATEGFFRGDSNSTIQMDVVDLKITAANSTTGGRAISYIGSASKNPIDPVLNNVIIESGISANFAYGINFDGSNSDAGIQGVNIYGVRVGALCTISNITMNNVKNSSQISFLTSGIVEITGTSITRRCENLNISHASNTAKIAFGYCNNITCNAATVASVTNTVNSLNVTFFGNVISKQRNSSTFQYIGFSDFTSNQTGNGYQKLPGGMILQWVSDITVNGDSVNPTNVTLPIAFNTANFGCFGVCDLSTGSLTGGSVTEIVSSRTLTNVSFGKQSKLGTPVVNILVIGF